MAKRIFQLLLFTLCLLGIGVADSLAQQPIRGNWTFRCDTPIGVLSVHCSFNRNNKGLLLGFSETGTLPFVYRQQNDSLSVAFEGPGIMPDGSDVTVIFRGREINDHTIIGTGEIVTELADPNNPIGYFTYHLDFVGSKDQ